MRINGIQVHESVTIDAVMNAAESAMTGLDNPGFCLICGTEADGCEPDMRRGHCEHCGADQVYGAEQLLIMMC